MWDLRQDGSNSVLTAMPNIRFAEVNKRIEDKTLRPGYIYSATVADTGQQIMHDGNGVAAGTAGAFGFGKEMRQGYIADPRIVSVQFQPINPIMRFEVDETGLALGDVAQVLFDARESTEHGRSSAMFKVIKLEGNGAIQMEIIDRNPLLAFDLRLHDVASDRLAFAERMSLDFVVWRGKRVDQIMRLPAGAIVRDGERAMVWLVIAEMAVPIELVEIERGVESSLVMSGVGVRGLPVSSEHWRALSSYGRMKVFLSTKTDNGAPAKKLLAANALMIAHPTAALRPGLKIRNDNVQN